MDFIRLDEFRHIVTTTKLFSLNRQRPNTFSDLISFLYSPTGWKYWQFIFSRHSERSLLLVRVQQVTVKIIRKTDENLLTIK